MKKTILLLSFFIFGTAQAEVDCSKHKIYCKIKSLRPSMNSNKAFELSNIIYKKSIKYNGDANLAVAIAMQETSLKERHREQNVIQFHQNCVDGECVEGWTIERGYSDICMFQFHVNTIVHHKMNPVKLKNDLNYCVDRHFYLMAIKKKNCRSIDKPWACYHSKNKRLRTIYASFVERYL